MKRLGAPVFLALLSFLGEVSAVPQTWLRPSIELEGVTAGARFGSKVACSSPALDVGSRSVVAVGAPSAEMGAGAVYLFDPAKPAQAFEILRPVGIDGAGQFGSAVEFVSDINGDGIDEIVVGAPHTASSGGGAIFAFVSLLQGDSLTYVQCGSEVGNVSFGAQIRELKSRQNSLGVMVAVAAPTQSTLSGYLLQMSGANACSFSQDPDLTSTGELGSSYGASLAEVMMGNGTTDLLVSAPNTGSLGTITALQIGDPLALKESSIKQPISPGVGIAGASVASSFSSGIFAVGNPRGADNRGQVSLHATDTLSNRLVCNVELSVDENSQEFGRVVAHLGQSFVSLLGSNQVVVAVSRSEASTGGAVALIGATSSGCSATFELNNCQEDPLQEQAAALAGGEACQLLVGGAIKRMLVSGSPGWHEGRGRVDISFEGSEVLTPIACDSVAQLQPLISPIITGSATPLITPFALGGTPSPTATPYETWPPILDSPFATPTAAQPSPVVSFEPTTANPAPPSGSATPANLEQQPENTPEVTPGSVGATPTSSYQDAILAVTASATAEGTGAVETQPDPTPTTESGALGGSNTPTPIAVSPGDAGLPTPAVIDEGGQVQVVMPAVTAQLSEAQQKRAMRALLKKKGMTRVKAASLVADPGNLEVTYIVQYSRVSKSVAFSLIQSAYAEGAPSKRSSTISRIRSRNNRVTLARLQPGQTYEVSYQVEISLKRPKTVLGITRRSGSTRFRAPAA